MKTRLALLGLITCCSAFSAVAPGALEFTPEMIGVPPLSLSEVIGNGMVSPTKPSQFGSAILSPKQPRVSAPRVPPRSSPKSQMPVVEPDPSIDFKLVVVPPDPNVDFKLIVKSPDGEPVAQR